MVTPLGGSGVTATPPLAGGESWLPPAHWEDWLTTPPGHLRAGAAPGVPDRLEKNALLTANPSHPDPGSALHTPPGGGGGPGAVTRAPHLRSQVRKALALRPAHLRSASWSPARDGRRHLGTPGGCGGAPHLFPVPGPELSRTCRRSQPACIPLYPSLPPACRGTGICSRSPEPVRRRGEGKEARDESREGVPGPEPD